MKKNECELGVYRMVENSSECVEVITQGTFDECRNVMYNTEIEDGQFFDISDLDENGYFTGQSWQYDKDGNDITDKEWYI